MTGTGPFDDRGAPDPSPLASDYELDTRWLQSVGLVPKAGPVGAIDVDPSAVPPTLTVADKAARYDLMTAMLRRFPLGLSTVADEFRAVLEGGRS